MYKPKELDVNLITIVEMFYFAGTQGFQRATNF